MWYPVSIYTTPRLYFGKTTSVINPGLIPFSTEVQNVFNREKEVKFLVGVLQRPPSFTLITGPVNSGKSRIMDEALHKISQMNLQQKVLHCRMYQGLDITVLCIYDAHVLQESVIDNIKGQKQLNRFVNWLASITKEGLFQVVMSSSNSFVYNWLTDLLGNDRFNTIVIGNLSKLEAKMYWNTQNLPANDFVIRSLCYLMKHTMCVGATCFFCVLYTMIMSPEV